MTDEDCSYLRERYEWESVGRAGEFSVYNWGEWPGVNGPVLVCVTHGYPGWGEVYDRLDDDATRGIPCQALPAPSSPDAKKREPQPGDGPDYHAEHAAWRNRRSPNEGNGS